MTAADVLELHAMGFDGVNYTCRAITCADLVWESTLGFAKHQLDALKAAGYGLVKLPGQPSEYWGPQHQPQWNHYPFTRVDGDEIEIGARSEHVYRVNVAEARILAADIIAAVTYATESS